MPNPLTPTHIPTGFSACRTWWPARLLSAPRTAVAMAATAVALVALMVSGCQPADISDIESRATDAEQADQAEQPESSELTAGDQASGDTADDASAADDGGQTNPAAPAQAPAPEPETDPGEPELDVINSGMYVTGELEPGTYRVAGYWARLDSAGDIIDNGLTFDEGVTLLHVDGTEDVVEISGEAVPLEQMPRVDPIELGLTDGVYLVGIDVAPGQYRVTSPDGASYIARLDSTLDIIDNALSEGSVVMTLSPSDYAVEISGLMELLS